MNTMIDIEYEARKLIMAFDLTSDFSVKTNTHEDDDRVDIVLMKTSNIVLLLLRAILISFGITQPLLFGVFKSGEMEMAT